MLAMPSTLIGNAIGQVFFQEATKEKIETGKAINVFYNTIKKLLIIGIPSFGILFFLIEDLFAFVFGERWRIAGVYAQILTPFYLIRFVVSPVSIINQIYLKNKLGLYWQLGLLILQVLIVYIGYIFKFNFETVVYMTSIGLSLYFLYYIYIINGYLHKE
jgi:O-antigen/teichoic acid export membrane protein